MGGMAVGVGTVELWVCGCSFGSSGRLISGIGKANKAKAVKAGLDIPIAAGTAL